MQKTKIDWCDATWNPVTGCLHGCEYCYARKIANRFKGCDKFSTYGQYHQATWRRVNPGRPLEEALFEVDAKCPPVNIRFNPETQKQKTTKAPYPWGFQPTLRRDKLSEPQRWKKPRSIFVCSMADLFGAWVPDEWIHSVINACFYALWHHYLFLTKNPERYSDVLKYLPEAAKNMPYDTSELPSDFMMFGATATTNDQLAAAYKTQANWISIGPIQEQILVDDYMSEDTPIGERNRWDCVVIGAETGYRKGKVIPKKEWIMDIVDYCQFWNTPVFMKESLRPIMGDDFRQDQLPWQK